jgi:hypothetical protein
MTRHNMKTSNWTMTLSINRSDRLLVLKELNSSLVPPTSNLYIDNFIPENFNLQW